MNEKNYAASCAAHRYISLGNDRMASPVTIIKKRLIYATIAEGAIVEEVSWYCTHHANGWCTHIVV